MGSSKKHKEKREKKKHKKDRSREKDGHRKSRKSSHRTRDHEDASRKAGEKPLTAAEETELLLREIENETKKNIRIEVPVQCESAATAAGSFEDDLFDIDKLLDSKLSENPEFSSKRTSTRKFNVEDISRNLELVTSKKRPLSYLETSIGNQESSAASSCTTFSGSMKTEAPWGFEEDEVQRYEKRPKLVEGVAEADYKSLDPVSETVHNDFKKEQDEPSYNLYEEKGVNLGEAAYNTRKEVASYKTHKSKKDEHYYKSYEKREEQSFDARWEESAYYSNERDETNYVTYERRGEQSYDSRRGEANLYRSKRDEENYTSYEKRDEQSYDLRRDEANLCRSKRDEENYKSYEKRDEENYKSYEKRDEENYKSYEKRDGENYKRDEENYKSYEKRDEENYRSYEKRDEQSCDSRRDEANLYRSKRDEESYKSYEKRDESEYYSRREEPSYKTYEAKVEESRYRSHGLEPQEPDVTEEPGQSQLSLSIAETNKLRAKLGLKPLEEQIPGLGEVSAQQSTSETGVKEVFVKTENIAKKKETEKLKEKLKTLKEKRKIAAKLCEVKTLGESDSDDESAEAWVRKTRKHQEERMQAEKRAKALEEMDAEFGVGALVEEEFPAKKKKTYTSRDLRGLVVGHDHSMIKEGQRVILTLKDKGVLDEDDDVLQNVNFVDEERYAKNIENRKKKPDYRPYEEEYDEFGILKKKNLLSKYDEQIQGEKKKAFTIGSNVTSSKGNEIEMIRMKLKQKQGVSLEMENMKLASEYYTSDDMVQFKKPKKKRRMKKSSMLKADDLMDNDFGSERSDFGSMTKIPGLDIEYLPSEETELTDEQMEDTEIANFRRSEESKSDSEVVEDLSNVVVDEDQAEKELHSALNKARKLKQRKALAAPEKVVVDVLKKEEPKDADVKTAKTGPIVLNSIAEFCRTLGDIPTYGMSGNRDEEADELMDFERELMEERQRQELEAQNRGAWNEVNIDEEPTEIMIRENEPILEEEPDISLGVAGALQLAQKKGYLDKDTKKLLSGPRASSLQAQSYTIEEKFYEDDKFGKRDRYTGPIQDFKEKSSYRPDVKLEYIDDSGRLLNAKEAFRYLSHKFHGKGPGKNKVDKRMKKLDQDTKLKQMSSTDTPLNTVKLLQAKQKESQSAYIVLSGGSKTLTQTMISKTKNP